MIWSSVKCFIFASNLAQAPQLFDAQVVQFDVVEEVRAAVKSQSLNVNEVDGVRVTTDEGWWLLRASNTGAQLVARCEANEVIYK